MEREVSVLSTELRNARKELAAVRETAGEWETKVLEETKRSGRLQDNIAQFKKKAAKHEKKIEELEQRLARAECSAPGSSTSTQASARAATAHQPGHNAVDSGHLAGLVEIPMNEVNLSGNHKRSLAFDDENADTEPLVDLSDTDNEASSVPSKRVRTLNSSTNLSRANSHGHGHDDRPPQRPRFSSGTEWNLSRLQNQGGTAVKKKAVSGGVGNATFPIQCDRKGRPLGVIAVGSRKPMNKNS